MASAVDSRLAYARLSAVATASRLPTANRGSNNSYTTSWDTTGLAARLAGCLSDARDPASTTHSYADMIGARMFAIACGYEDCDDLDVLRFDPAFKLACGRLPESGRDLMSQPTLSRLENAPSWRELARLGLTMIDLFCDSFERVPQRIVLDIDDTPDAVHGGQQLALFNAHYDEYCFQPIHIFDAATAKPVLSLLRPGKRPSGDEAARVLRHVIGRIRRHWPRVEIAVRGDGHYGTPEVMDLLEDQGHGYILGLPGNARLSEIGQPWCEDLAQPGVAGKPENVAVALILQQVHDLGRAVMAVATHRDLDPGPMAPDAADDVAQDPRRLVTGWPLAGRSSDSTGLAVAASKMWMG